MKMYLPAFLCVWGLRMAQSTAASLDSSGYCGWPWLFVAHLNHCELGFFYIEHIFRTFVDHCVTNPPYNGPCKYDEHWEWWATHLLVGSPTLFELFMREQLLMCFFFDTKKKVYQTLEVSNLHAGILVRRGLRRFSLFARYLIEI